ncbi:MAG: T9SS type A sorting domain-containing protein [Bacteroidia bacterium]|nr:T9SS type A sorting domain-containing protein [Bacteroidia bacterium]
MKKITLVALFIANLSLSQTTFSPQMVNSCGGSGVVGTTYYDYTVGEPVTLFGGPACDSIFSGFQHCAIDTFHVNQTTITAGSVTTFCLLGSVALSAPSGSAYLWTNGATTQNITANVSGNYSVRVTNSCGDTIRSNTISVTTINPATPEICMVTVDSISQNNIIYWDKTLYNGVDSFFVYRDTANNDYGLIGIISVDSLSEFTDTVKTLYAADGNPNASSWRYKIAIKDTCGNIGAMSPFHQTMFFQNSSGNFSWNHYQIEGQIQPVPALSNYLFKRDDISSGVWNTIQTLSASSFAYTDPNYAIYQTTGSWRVYTSWTISCDPSRALVNTSRSNIRNQAAPLSINENDHGFVSIFPNPAKNQLTVNAGKEKIAAIEMTNTLGQIILIESAFTNNMSQRTINTSQVAAGIYFVNIITENGKRIVKKMIIEN